MRTYDYLIAIPLDIRTRADANLSLLIFLCSSDAIELRAASFSSIYAYFGNPTSTGCDNTGTSLLWVAHLSVHNLEAFLIVWLFRLNALILANISYQGLTETNIERTSHHLPARTRYLVFLSKGPARLTL